LRRIEVHSHKGERGVRQVLCSAELSDHFGRLSELRSAIGFEQKGFGETLAADPWNPYLQQQWAGVMMMKSHLCPPGTLTGEVDAASTASASFFWSRTGPNQAQMSVQSLYFLRNRIAVHLRPLEQV